MSDFVAVLKRTLDGLGETTPEMRQRVYDKARSTIAAKLDAMNPSPSPAVASRQRQALEDAIAQVENGYRKAVSKSEPLDELENVLNSLNGLKNQPVIPSRTPPPSRPAETAVVPASAARPASPAGPAPRAALPAPSSDRTSVRPPPAAPVAARAPVEDDLDEFEEQSFEAAAAEIEQPSRVDRNRSGHLGKIGIAAALVAALAAGAYAGWVNRDSIQQTVAEWTSSEPQDVATAPQEPEPQTPEPAEPEPAEPAPAPEPPQQPAEAPEPAEPEPAPAPAGPTKFTQKLNPDGSETEAGPSEGGPSVGEGTSVAAANQPEPQAPAPGPADPAPGGAPPQPEPGQAPSQAAGTPPAEDPATPPPETPAPGGEAPTATPAQPETPAAQPSAVAVAQKAIFYEERTSSLAGSAEPGSIVWSVVQESPGAGQPAEPAIRAEATIPSKDIQLRMTIRRNADTTLPASHIVEMIFLTPPNFDGGGVANVLRVALKGSEQDPGTPLSGIPAKISDGFFLIALNDAQADRTQNLRLLQERTWLDVPLVYNSGRRALFTMEKGIPGEKVFTDVLRAWGVPTSG